MDVIFVGSNFYKLDRISFLYPQAHILDNRINVFIDHHPSVLRRKHQVIQQRSDVVILMKVFAHPPRIPPQGSGNLPTVIKLVLAKQAQMPVAHFGGDNEQLHLVAGAHALKVPRVAQNIVQRVEVERVELVRRQA